MQRFRPRVLLPREPEPHGPVSARPGRPAPRVTRCSGWTRLGRRGPSRGTVPLPSVSRRGLVPLR